MPSLATILPKQKNTVLTFNKPVDTALSRNLIERLKNAYQAIGIDIRIIEFNHANSLNAANDGVLDGQIGRVYGISEDYPNLVPSQTPLLSLKLVMITNKGTCEECNPLRLSPLSHNKSYPFASKYLKQLNYQGELISVSNLNSQLTMLRQGNIKGVLVLQYRLQHLLDEKTLRSFDTHLVSEKPIYHYLHKKHATILTALDTQLQQTERPEFRLKSPK